MSNLFDLFGGRPSQSVHGPALPSDDADQIYDDFAGELAENRQSPDESESGDDEDAYNVWQEPEDDETTVEGLIMHKVLAIHRVGFGMGLWIMRLKYFRRI
ncbi:hypothetical protein B0H14DRAFT_2565056 [Mycena olivaceomarginata]|nr:hypothetical protein B0H14DRAFT_2565056 [Mycena olivaceomarginata]